MGHIVPQAFAPQTVAKIRRSDAIPAQLDDVISYLALGVDEKGRLGNGEPEILKFVISGAQVWQPLNVGAHIPCKMHFSVS